MRLTTLLDTLAEAGSGPWPPVAGPSITTPTPEVERTTQVEFDELVSMLIPCRANDAELWFAERTAEVELAKALCATCPVREGCLAGAIERQEPWGVWGGEVFIDGVVVPRKRGRGRPRKSEAS
ncbi:WhiB family transcriptional regulator [Actinotalea sp.]|uniref:WhiB family transcriptional regulator n=1 Tax=Actinotalea sp. TaxID=1872145 RepID=UPI0035616777